MANAIQIPIIIPADNDNNEVTFLSLMKELVAYSYNHTSHFPKRFGNNYTNRILMNVTTALEEVKHANNIHIDYKYYRYGKNEKSYETCRALYEKRTCHLESAIDYLKTLGSLLETGKDMNITELIEENNRVYKEFLDMIVREIKLIKGVEKSDANHFKKFSIVFGKDFAVIFR